jgi:hypothetical protein
LKNKGRKERMNKIYTKTYKGWKRSGGKGRMEGRETR